MKQYGDESKGRFTYEDVGFMIDHGDLDSYVIPLNKIVFEVTSDGAFAKPGRGYVVDHGKVLGSDSFEG